MHDEAVTHLDDQILQLTGLAAVFTSLSLLISSQEHRLNSLLGLQFLRVQATVPGSVDCGSLV